MTLFSPAFRENMLRGGPPLGGAAGPPGPGIGAILGKPEGGGGGGLLYKIKTENPQNGSTFQAC